MALQSEVSPPLVGDPNKDIKIDGDTKSEENDSSQSSDEDDVDLEEGEILDSGAEEEKEKDFSNSSLKDALDKNCLQNIEQLINQAKNVDNNSSPNHTKLGTQRKMNKRQGNYIDHDQEESNADQNDVWMSRSPKHKKSERPIDYRNELEAYRGTPPSSPERKKRDGKSRRKKSSKKSKKSSRKTITRKDAKGQRVMRYKKDAVRGKPCKYFKEGNCAKGSDCPFSHSLPEQKFRKKELCKFYLSGHCNKGKTCIYMHSEFPCKFYHTGSVCYAKEDCRFSHAPLTEEMKKVLSDYLRQVHGDRDHHREDDFHHREDEDRDHDRGRARERKRHHSRSPEPQTIQSQAPPPPKRVCLLGSPPRQIRESEETKRWQEEMKLLQHLPGFEINLARGEENMSPTNFPRPNFYQETLLNTSPQKHPIKMEGPNPLRPPPIFNHPIFPPRNFNNGSPTENYPYEEFQETEPPPMKEEHVDDFDWGDSQNTNDVKPNRNLGFNDNSQSDLDFTSDVKFDETTQFSEMESSTDGPPMLSPSKVEKENESSNQDASKSSEAASVNIQNQEQPPAPPIVIPSHLPRKQRELFMRVQQHNQQKISNIENTESQIKKESDEEEEKVESKTEESKWYSSEDDDDDSDELLTDVLKKIQQGPPLPKPAEKKPGVNLMEMLNKIQQNTEKNRANSALGPFLQNILGSSVPAPSPVTNSQTPPIVLETKRRTLLPDPVLPVLPPTDSFPVKETIHKDVPKDPRLKNRDPRTLASLANSSNTPKQIPSDRNNIGNNSPTLDLNSIGLKPLPSITNDAQKESIPYRLHNIYAKPPNYTPYLHASQSNPKLLNDPRLRKHLQPSLKTETPTDNGKDTEISKLPPPKDVPPIPELLLKYEKVDSFINIFESNSSTKTSDTAHDNKHPLPMAAQRVCDPRKIRRDSRSNSGSDTPPHLTIVDTIKSPPHQEFKSAPVLENALMEPISEKKKFPPILEKNWTPPVLEKHLSPEGIKKELDSDSESNHEPPKLECNGKTSFIKSPSPEREFIAITKESPRHDSDAPPVVPPLIIKKIKPTLASHLPRAIADPRMAKLHNPVDPRRLRLASSENRLVERKKQQPVVSNTSKLTSSNVAEESISFSPPEASKSPSGEVETVEKEDPPKSAKSIPKKRRLSDKSEEKKRTVHRNRKSSMDYASPLNSCDVTAPQKNSGYNSYNQRPKRNTNPLSDKVSTPLSSVEHSDSSSIPSFLPNNSSNLDCDNNCDGSLKDRFKTIDPTASPFC